MFLVWFARFAQARLLSKNLVFVDVDISALLWGLDVNRGKRVRV